jgi:hypothetical protein
VNAATTCDDPAALDTSTQQGGIRAFTCRLQAASSPPAGARACRGAPGVRTSARRFGRAGGAARELAC